MIDVVVQFNDTTANIDLPCSDVYLESQYMELHMPEDAERILFVKNVYFPESLSVLENIFIKMDELNYLAKRLCSFDKQELKQFEAVVRHNDMQEMKDLINLTFNLHKFTLIQGISNMEDVGRTHMLNMHGGLGVDEIDNYDFAAIGKELLLSGKGRITEYGILFDNEEMTFDEVYDGQVFPEYYYEDCQASAELRFNGKSEYLYMPCDELAVSKAVKRLGAGDMADCEIHLMNCNVENQGCFEYMQELVGKGEFHQANELAQAISSFKEEDWDKFGAIVEYSEVEKAEEIIQLARNLNKFIYIPGIDDDDELGRYWIEHNDEYELSPELEDFFLYDQFGEQLQNQLKGRFVETGYVCMADGYSLEEIAIFSGDLEIDTDALHQEVASIYQSEFQAIEDKTEEIKDAMIAAGYSARADEAQMIFLMALYEKNDETDLVERLVGCFAENQTDEELIAIVNSTFGVEISAETFTNAMASIRAAYIDTSGYTDPSTKNNLDLVQWAINAERNGWGYVWGTYGQVLDEGKYEAVSNQYPDEVGGYAEIIEQNWLYKRTADCIGLIKGYCWFNADTGDVEYATNGTPDVDANSIYYDATERGEISTIPEIPGLAVWQEGHIGIYIGNGEVIEAMGTQYGVVKTQLADGNWTHWLKIPYITYVEQETGTEAETE